MARSNNEQPSTPTLATHNNDNLKVNATSFAPKSGIWHLPFETKLGGKVIQTFQLQYDPVGYTPYFCNDIDINQDGVRDLSIATGSGKGGDGAYYWIRTSRTHYKALGEYPALTRCSNGSSNFYANNQGSNQTIFTRNYYRFYEDALTEIVSIDISSGEEDGTLNLEPHFSKICRKATDLDIKGSIRDVNLDSYLLKFCSQL